jgi:TonB family protein
MLASLVLVSFVALVTHPPIAQPPLVEASVQQPEAVPTPEQKPWPPKGVSRPGPGIVSPRVVKHVYPSYTPETMRAGIEGAVYMEAVVLADGSVGEVRVTRSLEPGLDDQAVRTLEQWRFEPGRRDGVAVPVLIEMEMWFTMRDGKLERIAAVVPSTGWPPTGAVRPGSGVQSPRLVHEVKPSYTPAAMRAGIEGMVWMEAVVGPDGRVSDVRVTQSLDAEHGLDDQAVQALRQWRFAPGRRGDVPVSVVVEVQMSFVIRK